MKFYAKNEFIYKGVRKLKGDVIDIPSTMIGSLKKMDVLGEPVKQAGSDITQKAVIKPKETRKRRK
ncbi:MAG: hypothetical protein WC319_09785 [Candidatus Paceibacterota bacterium]|jgi:hypothetical protein|nr:hypothetical protein [Clostridiales bacterium]